MLPQRNEGVEDEFIAGGKPELVTFTDSSYSPDGEKGQSGPGDNLQRGDGVACSIGRGNADLLNRRHADRFRRGAKFSGDQG